MRYAVVIENAGSNFSTYVPDLPGCVATGATLAEAEGAIRDAIQFHLDGLREDGSPIPLHRARLSASKLPPNKSLERTRGR
jgi:predicted RNase H-like HicB family nuclease